MTAILVLAEPHGIGMELQSRIQANLETDIVAVYLDCTRADVQLVSGILTGVPLGDKLENLEFAVGEPMDMRRVETLLRVASGQRFDGLARDS